MVMKNICDICYEYIRLKKFNKKTGKIEKTDEVTVNYLEKVYRDSRGNYHVYYTKAHSRCLRRLEN